MPDGRQIFSATFVLHGAVLEARLSSMLSQTDSNDHFIKPAGKSKQLRFSTTRNYKELSNTHVQIIRNMMNCELSTCGSCRAVSSIKICSFQSTLTHQLVNLALAGGENYPSDGKTRLIDLDTNSPGFLYIGNLHVSEEHLLRLR